MGRIGYLAIFTGAIALVPVAGQATSAADEPDPVAAFSCGADRQAARQGLQAIADAYSQRSVAIIRAALTRDMDSLRKMIAPSASFILFKGDVGTGPRGTGADAAAEFLGGIKPAAYQFSTASRMPSIADPCGQTEAEVMLTGRKPGEAVLATFKYRAGILAEVNARRIALTRGVFVRTAQDR